VTEPGDWGSGDDRRLLKALYKSGATEEYELDWNELVPNRTAQQTRRRWRLMLKCLKDAVDKTFTDKLTELVTRFTPDLKAKHARVSQAEQQATVQVSD
jgi:hypothetical protein